MTIQQKMIKNMDLSLLEIAVKGIQSLYQDLNPRIFSYNRIKETFVSAGLPDILTSEMDTNYAFLDVSTIDDLLWDAMFLINKFKYRTDVTDCDNFAFFTSSLMSFLYGINTVGTCWGNIYNDSTGNLIAAHYFNVLITHDPVFNRFDLWIADSMNPGLVKIEVGKPIVLGNWRYEKLRNAKFF